MEVSGKPHSPAALPQGKSCAHWTGGWVGPIAILDAVVKRKIPSPRRESNYRTPIVQPVVQCFNDWAITAHAEFVGGLHKWQYIRLLNVSKCQEREAFGLLQLGWNYFKFRNCCYSWKTGIILWNSPTLTALNIFVWLLVLLGNTKCFQWNKF
jgi:hypothetical protein